MQPMWTKFAVWVLLGTGAAAAQEPQWLDLSGNYLADADPQEAYLAAMLYRVAARTATQAKDREGFAAAADLGTQALQVNNANVASRLLARATAGAQGRPMGEPFELAYTLQFTPEARIVTTGAPLRARVEPILMPAEPGLKQQYTVQITMKDSAGTVLRTAKVWKLDRVEAQDFALPTAGLPDGEYLLAYELRDAQGSVLAAVERPILLNTQLRERIRSLERRLQPLAGKAVPPLALQTARELVETYRAALTSYPASGKAKMSPLLALLAGPQVPLYPRDGFDPSADLAQAEEMITKLEAGQDPLAHPKGRLRLGANWAYVPAAEKPAGVVIAISGEWGDGSVLVDSLAQAAERSGLIVVGVEAGTNIEAAVARLRPLFPAGRLFLLGHAGGVGVALQLASRNYAAVALVSGMVSSWSAIAPKFELPAKIVAPTADAWFETDDFRRFAYQATQRFAQVEYTERAGASRLQLLSLAAGEICEFFTQMSEGKWKPNGVPIPLPSSSRKRN